MPPARYWRYPILSRPATRDNYRAALGATLRPAPATGVASLQLGLSSAQTARAITLAAGREARVLIAKPPVIATTLLLQGSEFGGMAR
jgi:hypothetical protein